MVRLLFLLIISLQLGSNIAIASHNTEPVRGVLDLRDTKIDDKFIIKLNGEWEFYWNQHLRPYQFKGDKAPVPDGFIKVPSYWTDAKLPGLTTEGKGHATYRLLILLPEDVNVPLGLDVKVFDSSYDLYVNGAFLGSNGVSGTSEESSLPEYEPRIYKLPAGSDTAEVIFNVSNFHHRRGGFWLPVEFGTFREVQSVAARRFGAAISNVSILSAFFVFFIFFFLLYREDKISLYFAIALMGMAVRPLVTNQFIIYLFFRPDWQWIVRLEYLSLYMSLTGGFLFLYALYKSLYQRFFAILVPIVFSLMAIATLILPVSAFSYLTLPSYLFVFIFAINSIVCSGIQLYTKRSVIAMLYFFGVVLIVYAALHDVLLSARNSSGHGVYILSEAIIAFIFIQAGLLIFKWVKSFREKERLKNNLEQINRDLESIVNTRTRELINAKNQAEEYSKQIEKQNADLTETIHLKNKVFSVIAHDLRSPVVNIQYILNLLKEDEFRDKYESLAGSCINYSQMVINLLENMLVWGRGQEDRIRYMPDYQDLAGLILTNMSMYKDNADRKSISVNFTQIGGTRAYIDKDLMDIVIRNLLSNAIKYTYKGGRISILLKDRPSPDDEIMIRICDNGVGIDPIRQSLIFNSNEIESTPGTENEKGTGFGLKLSYELVRVNRGTIEMESKAGEGTCFTIILPATKERSEVKESLQS